MAERPQSCFNCGAELGVYSSYPGEIEACGGCWECAGNEQMMAQFYVKEG